MLKRSSKKKEGMIKEMNKATNRMPSNNLRLPHTNSRSNASLNQKAKQNEHDLLQLDITQLIIESC